MFRTLREALRPRPRRMPRRCRPALERLEDRLTPADMPPTVVLAQPAAGAVLSGTGAFFFGDATDDVGTVRAEFYVDGVLRSTDVNGTGRYHFGGGPGRFDTTALANGPHVLGMVVYDTAGQSGSAQVNVVGSNTTTLGVVGLVATPSGFTVQFSRAIDPGPLNLFDAPVAGPGPADVTLVGRATGPVQGSLVLDPNGRGVNFVRTGGPLAADTYTVTLRSAGNGFRDTSGVPLDGNRDGTPGDNYASTFTVAASSVVTVSVPDFTRGPGQPVHLPADAGLPLRLSDGSGVSAVSLTINYNPALLTLTGAAPGAGMPAGATASLTLPAAGTAVLSFSSPVLGAGSIDFVRLTAQIPASAPQGAAQLLTLAGVQLNGSVTAQADAGLHLVGHAGDASGNGLYSAADALRALRVSVGLDGGFGAYPLIDPAVVADVTGNGSLNAADATRVLQEAAGLDPPAIPDLPAGIPPTVTVRAADADASEVPGDPATFLVSRTGSLAGALTVPYAAGGTAMGGSDYGLLPGSTTIPAGAASVMITVAPLNDALVERPETVTLALAPGAGYTVGPAGLATATLRDDDGPAGRVTFGVIGDFDGTPVRDVANLIKSWNPDFIATVGDNNYPSGAASTIDINIGQYFHDFIFPYQGSFGAGAAVNRFWPALGNHDWDTPGAVPYLNYFTLPSTGGVRNE